MSLRPTAFAVNGDCTIRHDEAAHAATVTLGSMAFNGLGPAPTVDYLTLTCPTEGVVSVHPVSGGVDPVNVQLLFARTITRDAAALGIAAPDRTWPRVLSLVKTRVEAMKGRFALGKMLTETTTYDPTTGLFFLLAGQSNANGYDTQVEASDPSDGAIALFDGVSWRPVLDPSTPGQSLSVAGPAVPFARALVAAGATKVGLILAAEGASGINSWRRGHPLYDRARTYVADSGATLSGVLYYQGEEEAAYPFGQTDSRGEVIALAASWGALFAQIVRDWRTDAGNAGLTVIYARIAHYAPTVNFDAGAWASVQAQQDASQAPRVLLVPTETATLLDLVHLDPASQRVVGQRMAAAWATP